MLRSKIMLLFLSLLSYHAVAQFKNVTLAESQSPGGSYDPAVAINWKDPKNIVITSGTDEVFVSKDGGANWKPVKITYAGGLNGQSAIVSDDKGNFFYSHLSTVNGVQRIIIHESKDGGNTWSEGQPLDDDEDNIKKDHRWASISSDAKGNLIATWTQTDQYGSDSPDCHSQIMYSKSSNGKKWSKPFLLSQGAGGCVAGAGMLGGSSSAVSADGKVYAVWVHEHKIVMDRSFNGGGMWLSSDIPLADQTGNWKMDVDGVKDFYATPQMVIDRSKGPLSGSIYVVWSDQTKGNTDVLFTRSNNGGDNWTQAYKFTAGSLDHQQYFAAMAVDQSNGVLYVAYYDRSEGDLKTDVYLAYSIDGGSTFKNTKLSETPFVADKEVAHGAYISVTAHKGVVVPAWTRVENGKTVVITTVVTQDQLLPKPASGKK